jgi:ubiquinone/menaquinone biosynthesis C-methylase UbiE
VLGRSLDSSFNDQREWLKKHFYEVPKRIKLICNEFGVEMSNKVVLDFGCGDSIIDLGLIELVKPSQIIATDVNYYSNSISKKRIRHFLGENLDSSAKLIRIQNTEFHIPIESESIDVAFSWSTFEHVSHPYEALQELQRVIKPNGYLIIQIFPMYFSAHGHHMWWDSNFPAFLHLQSPELFESRLQEFKISNEYSQSFKAVIVDEVDSLNRIKVEEIKELLFKLNLKILAQYLDSEALEPIQGLGCYTKNESDIQEIFIVCQKMN